MRSGVVPSTGRSGDGSASTRRLWRNENLTSASISVTRTARIVTMLAPPHRLAPARSAEATAPEQADVPEASASCWSSGRATREHTAVSSPRDQSRTHARATSAADGGTGRSCAATGPASAAEASAAATTAAISRFPERRTVRGE
jgi:hypothetical protein